MPMPTKDEIDQRVDEEIVEYQVLLDLVGDEAEFICPSTKRIIKGREIIDYVDKDVRETLYKEFGIIDSDNFDRAMSIL